MIKEVLFQIQHLKFVNLDSGKYCLIVEDTEVNDYVEEYMLENGIETMQQAQYYWRKFKAIRDKELTKENALTKTDLYGLLLLK